MSLLFSLYNEVLYRPLLNGMVWFYVNLPWQDLGLAIITLTVTIRLVLTPLLWKAQKAQKELSALQPDIKKIQEKFKNNREGQGRALAELYAKNKVNPFSGCVMMLIQFPVLITLFYVFQKGLDAGELKNLYLFIENPGVLNTVAFGLIDLAKGNIFLGAVAAVAQFIQTKMSLPAVSPSSDKGDFSKIMQWQTTYLFPALILVWSYTLPSALVFYWTVMSILGILQEIIMKRIKKDKQETKAVAPVPGS